MKKPTSNVPEGYNAVMPYLTVADAAAALAFYKRAFGAKQRMLLKMGTMIGHAEVEIGGCVIMLADEMPDFGNKGPRSLNGSPVTLCVNVADVDKAMAKAVAAGGTIKTPAADHFYGYRMGQIEDPFGHVWMLQHQFEAMTPREMQKRMDKMMAEQAGAAPAKPAQKAKGK